MRVCACVGWLFINRDLLSFPLQGNFPPLRALFSGFCRYSWCVLSLRGKYRKQKPRDPMNGERAAKVSSGHSNYPARRSRLRFARQFFFRVPSDRSCFPFAHVLRSSSAQCFSDEIIWNRQLINLQLVEPFSAKFSNQTIFETRSWTASPRFELVWVGRSDVKGGSGGFDEFSSPVFIPRGILFSQLSSFAAAVHVDAARRSLTM